MPNAAELITSPAVRTRAEELAIEADLLNEKHQWQSATSDLARLQAEEIDRLNRVIADHHAMPARKIVFGNLAHARGPRNEPSTVVFVLDDHHAAWTITLGTGDTTWQRLPALPTPGELVKLAENDDFMVHLKAARS